MPTKLKGVIIGCGAIAREHLAALAALDNAEAIAVCDLSPARAEFTAERFGVAKWYSNYEQMLADIRPDLVHITTPPSSHFTIAKTCLAKGLNVLCEKPIAMGFQQFHQLKQLATEKTCALVENQNLRFHSSIKRMQELQSSGRLGDVLDMQICLSLNLMTPESPYIDLNAPHFSLSLRGGVIGDFLPHISYLAQMFTGPTIELRTIWTKRTPDTPLPADEFRGLIMGKRATAYVTFSGNTQLNGFWVRIIGSRIHAEANLFETPRITFRRYRSGEPALMTFIDGLAESRDVLRNTVAGFWRKLGGVTSYDGLPEFLARTYRAIEMREPMPVSLDEIDASVQLVDRFTNSAFKL
jgi:predicted dehydrogenase